MMLKMLGTNRRKGISKFLLSAFYFSALFSSHRWGVSGQDVSDYNADDYNYFYDLYYNDDEDYAEYSGPNNQGGAGKKIEFTYVLFLVIIIMSLKT